jgi:hypothetical protein
MISSTPSWAPRITIVTSWLELADGTVTLGAVEVRRWTLVGR